MNSRVLGWEPRAIPLGDHRLLIWCDRWESDPRTLAWKARAIPLGDCRNVLSYLAPLAGLEPATHCLAYHCRFLDPNTGCGLDCVFAFSGRMRTVSTEPFVEVSSALSFEYLMNSNTIFADIASFISGVSP